MKFEDTSEQASQAVEQSKALYNRALKKAREKAEAADQMVHRHAYNALAAGIVVGFITGFLVSRGCRSFAS